jgi:hypothetical protein
MTKELREDQDSYKVVDSSMLDKKGSSFQGGRYIGTSPMKAAKKAAKKLFALPHDKEAFSHHKHQEHIVFKLLQTTRGSEHKEYIYKAKKLKGKTEMTTIKVGNRSIQVRKGPAVDVSPAEDADLVRAIHEAKGRIRS